MRRTTVLCAALMASAGMATAAQAQRDNYGGGQQQQRQQQQQRLERQDVQQGEQPKTVQNKATVTIGDRQVEISVEFAKAYQATEAALTANDNAAIASNYAAAQAAAKLPEEQFLLAQLQLKVASKSNNTAEIAAALDKMIASGFVGQDQLPAIYSALGRARYNLKQYDQAAAAFDKALQMRPNDLEVISFLAQTRASQGKAAESVALLQKSIAAKRAAGEKPSEDVLKRALTIAYNAKLPTAVSLSREWVAAYPSADNWRDALRVYRTLADPDDAVTLDALRLARAAGAIEGDNDFYRYAFLANKGGFPAEAKAVLDQGFAAKKIDPKAQMFSEIAKEVNAKAAGERAAVDDEAKAALAAPAASRAVAAGDLLYGLGEYARAAELYRAALGKSGADKDLINYRLGLALAQAGDKAGAKAAFEAVAGQRAELAKYALVYVNTNA